jgi:hypothetical protein
MRRLSARDAPYRMGCGGVSARLGTVRRAASAAHRARRLSLERAIEAEAQMRNTVTLRPSNDLGVSAQVETVVLSPLFWFGR